MPAPRPHPPQGTLSALGAQLQLLGRLAEHLASHPHLEKLNLSHCGELTGEGLLAEVALDSSKSKVRGTPRSGGASRPPRLSLVCRQPAFQALTTFLLEAAKFNSQETELTYATAPFACFLMPRSRTTHHALCADLSWRRWGSQGERGI